MELIYNIMYLYSHKLTPFIADDILLFKEYRQVFKPVAVTLVILQSEVKAFMGLLLPAITMYMKKLKVVKDKRLYFCSPLVDCLIVY
jgi:hypothetical protein